jgi:hypothetical protein
MQIVTGINNNPSQVFSLNLPDGTSATFTLSYRPNQKGWYYDMSWNGTNPSFQVNGCRITVFPNILRAFKNKINFGLACLTTDGYEPMNLNDFNTKYANLYVLTETEVQSIESSIFTLS